MKKFKYSFNYKSQAYSGFLESPEDLHVFGNSTQLKLRRIMISRYGFGEEFMNYTWNISVTRVEDEVQNKSNNSSNLFSLFKKTDRQKAQEEWDDNLESLDDDLNDLHNELTSEQYDEIDSSEGDSKQERTGTFDSMFNTENEEKPKEDSDDDLFHF